MQQTGLAASSSRVTPPENPFTQSAVPIAAGHDEICFFLLHNVQELGGSQAP
jgi:hypothetical protein